MNKRIIQILVAFLVFGLWTEVALACHAVAPINITQQNGDGSYLALGGSVNGNSVRVRGQASGQTCGCGPYYLEFEVIPTTQSYSGSHNYTSPGDNRSSCYQNTYGWTYINNLTPGVSYKWRVREYTSGSGARSNWVEYANPAFTVNGSSNSTPIATTQSVTGNEDETQTITLIGSDADGNTLTYTVESGPSHGTVNQDYSSVLDFDGANDYLSIDNPTGIPSGNDAYTIAAWIKPSSMGTRGIVGWGNWGSGNRCNALRLMGSNQIRHYWWGNDLDVTCGDLTDGWHYIVAL